MLRPRVRENRAFTYVEIALVGAIIATLAAIAIPNFLEAQVRARVSRSKADMAMIRIAIHAYRSEHGMFPLNSKADRLSAIDLQAVTTPIAFLSVLPPDPFAEGFTSTGFHVGNCDIASYRYLNGLQVVPEEGLAIAQPDYPSLFSGFKAGLLIGYGPHAVQSGTQFVEPLGFARVRVLPYDPTNGTTSTGDIYARVP